MVTARSGVLLATKLFAVVPEKRILRNNPGWSCVLNSWAGDRRFFGGNIPCPRLRVDSPTDILYKHVREVYRVRSKRTM